MCQQKLSQAPKKPLPWILPQTAIKVGVFPCFWQSSTSSQHSLSQYLSIVQEFHRWNSEKRKPSFCLYRFCDTSHQHQRVFLWRIPHHLQCWCCWVCACWSWTFFVYFWCVPQPSLSPLLFLSIVVLGVLMHHCCCCYLRGIVTFHTFLPPRENWYQHHGFFPSLPKTVVPPSMLVIATGFSFFWLLASSYLGKELQ